MNEYDLQVAKALEMARAKAGLSQEKLAKQLGISKPTVASRERGTSPVTLADIINWCVACSVPARRCMDACIYPGLLDYLQEDISTEEKRQILHAAVDEMSNYEVDGWLYLYYGDHGSDPMGVLTEVLANLHTPLRDRVSIVNAIIGCALLMSRAWSTGRAGRSGSSNLTGLAGLTVRFVRAVHCIPPIIQPSDNSPT